MPRLEHSSIDARIARVCDPVHGTTRYSVLYSNPHTGEVGLYQHNILPSDIERYTESLRGQGCVVHWSGLTSDFASWAKVPRGFKL